MHAFDSLERGSMLPKHHIRQLPTWHSPWRHVQSIGWLAD